MTPRKYRPYRTSYIITDEQKFGQINRDIDKLERKGLFHKTGPFHQEIIDTFPAQSWGVKIGNEVAIFSEGYWKEVTVTEDNLSEMRKMCHIGIITHQKWKLSLPLAEQAA